MKRLLLIGWLLALANGMPLHGQTSLAAGPMLGATSMREVSVWVQTAAPASVTLRFWPETQPKKVQDSNPVSTESKFWNAGRVTLMGLEPGTRYAYQVKVENAQVGGTYYFKTLPLWQYRTDPPVVRFATGSCSFFNDSLYDRPGKPYGGDYQIFSSIAATHPDFMVWLGDNTYLREVDYDSRSGIFSRYARDRARPELQELLRSCPQFAIWDDHDFGPNDCDGSYRLKKASLEAFEAFWANPSYGIPGREGEGGITTAFSWGDLDFFLLDNRWWRSANERRLGEKTLHGLAQLDWVLNALKSSRASFKFVCTGGQVLSDLDKYETYFHLAPGERKWLLENISDEKIPGVVFLTGDRHHTELSMWQQLEGYPIFDFTVSPLTSSAYDAEDEVNTFRVPGTQYGQRNFALVECRGPLNGRILELSVRDKSGNPVWSKKLNANGLIEN